MKLAKVAMNSQEDLAKFGHKLNMKIIFLAILLANLLETRIEERNLVFFLNF
jgi:hypothetical protein